MKKIIQKIWNSFCVMCTFSTKNTPQKQLPVKTKTTKAVLAIQLEEYLFANYQFRYNVLTNEVEYQKRQPPDLKFKIVGQREQNTLCIDAQKSGINCWDRDIQRILYSNRTPNYHPFSGYLESLPEWDGVERIRALAQRVSDDENWIKSFHKWMLALTAQWSGMDGLHANSVAPVLISKEQGRLKSTFCKSLMPPALERYYTDNVNLTIEGQADRKLCEMGLINLDEFDRFSSRKMAYLKNLMQMATPNLRKAHQKSFHSHTRIASFIATSNRKDLLTDPSGSRRFICVEVAGKINCAGIEYDQIYAQLQSELHSGVRYWFTGDEEQELQLHNRAFYRQSPAEEVFRTCFRAVQKDEEGELLSAAEIFKFMKKHNSAAMRGTNPAAFARTLPHLGIDRIHTKRGNVYKVVTMV